MTHNQKLLAQMVAREAVHRASRAHLPPPQNRVVEALGEAIESKRSELLALVWAGRFETDVYHEAKAQLARWTEAWNSNR